MGSAGGAGGGNKGLLNACGIVVKATGAVGGMESMGSSGNPEFEG
jgi:hypothetical protein